METNEITAEDKAAMQGDPAPETPEETPAEKPAPEPPVEVPIEKPTEAPTETPEDKPEAMVPSYRLREETTKREALEDKVSKMNTTFETFKERFKDPPPAPSTPYDEDPTEHIRQQAEIDRQASTEQVAKLQDDIKNFTEEQKQQYAEIQFTQARDSHVTAFKQSTPDYDAASDFISEMKSREYKAVGIIEKGEIEKGLQGEWNNFAYKVMAAGGDPAKAMYELAIANGYKANGSPQKTQAEKTIETIEKGQAVSKSLAGAGGGSGDPSLEQIANMDEKDLMKVFDDPEGWEKLMKGSG